MKNFRWDNQRKEPMADIICNDCKCLIGSEGYYDGILSKEYLGLNNSQHECSFCKHKRKLDE